jgi:hypothetical protein
MLQLIITGIIVATALGIAIYRAVVYLRNPIRGCNGCEKGCGGCSLEELKKEIEAKRAAKKM